MNDLNEYLYAASIQLFGRSVEYNGETMDAGDICRLAVKRIQELSSCSQLKKGRWQRKWHRQDMDGMTITGQYPTCNLCGFAEMGISQETNFCPNCGADMR